MIVNSKAFLQTLIAYFLPLALFLNELYLIKDSNGQNNGVKVHIELESSFDESVKANLDTQYTL